MKTGEMRQHFMNIASEVGINPRNREFLATTTFYASLKIRQDDPAGIERVIKQAKRAGENQDVAESYARQCAAAIRTWF